MIISNISFFIDCVSLLREQYQNADTVKKNQLVTFLKTWLFYNSTSKSIFWTGMSTEGGKVEKVKEHRFSNKATTRYLLENDLQFENKVKQVLWIFERMQWNYTNKDENKRMSPLQQYETFYGRLQGSLNNLYSEATIALEDEKPNVNFYPKLENILQCTSSKKATIVEIEIESNKIKNFEKGLIYAVDKLNAKIDYITVPQRGFIISSLAFSDLLKAIQSGYLSCMKISELNRFALQYGYRLNQNAGPYRMQNTFNTQKDRVFKILVDRTPIYLTTYNNTVYKKDLINTLASFFDSKVYFFDAKLNLITEE